MFGRAEGVTEGLNCLSLRGYARSPPAGPTYESKRRASPPSTSPMTFGSFSSSRPVPVYASTLVRRHNPGHRSADTDERSARP